MEDQKKKRVLNIELDENMKKVSITGLGDDNKEVMKQELDKEELDQAAGGWSCKHHCYVLCYKYEQAVEQGLIPRCPSIIDSDPDRRW